MASQGRAGKARKRPLMRFTGARNDKARGGLGLDGLGGRSLGLVCGSSVMRILTDCSSLVNHPTTPKCSGNLVGETTRRYALNPDRGGGPLDAQREAGKREPHGETRKVAGSRVAPCSHNPLHDYLGVISSCNRAEFTISHRGKTWTFRV